VTKNRDESGKATVELTALNAGPKAQIHYATTPEVSASSPTVPDVVFESDATVLWFLAVDPEGKLPIGDAEKWTNTLTLGPTTSRVTIKGDGRSILLVP
jgi:hypothetical protein